jgi:VanZ family protein
MPAETTTTLRVAIWGCVLLIAALSLRMAAWGCVLLIAVLSLLPADAMARTGQGGFLEHALAYAGTAFLIRLAYPNIRAARPIGLLVAYAALLELLQHFSPGRTPGLDTWLASSVGALLGGAVAGLWDRFLMRGSSRRSTAGDSPVMPCPPGAPVA